MVNGEKLIEIGGSEIMKRYFFLVVLVLLAYVAPIAVTQAAGPGPVDQAKLQQIKLGGTTEPQVRSLLGEPTSAKDEQRFIGAHAMNRLVSYKVLKYGPEGSEIFIYINEQGKVFKIAK